MGVGKKTKSARPINRKDKGGKGEKPEVRKKKELKKKPLGHNKEKPGFLEIKKRENGKK